MLPYEKRPVWYVFSGMGSQWPAMAKDLMQIEIFRKSIQKSAEILKPYFPDLMDILTDECRSDISMKYNANAERKIISAFVSIAAIQVMIRTCYQSFFYSDMLKIYIVDIFETI